MSPWVKFAWFRRTWPNKDERDCVLRIRWGDQEGSDAHLFPDDRNISDIFRLPFRVIYATNDGVL